MTKKQRLDLLVVEHGLTATRSQAESYIKLGKVTVGGRVITKPGFLISVEQPLELQTKEYYVSRAGLKLASVADVLKIEFRDKVILDVGSSTGGFTDYALQHGAKKVIAVELGTEQMHPSLRGDSRVELHEKTDVRDFHTGETIDLVVADVSFVSLRDILPAVAQLVSRNTDIVVMVKPQFEANVVRLKHKGVIKNDRIRRDILKDFETWARQHFIVLDKADSEVAGAKGNKERFYLVRKFL